MHEFFSDFIFSFLKEEYTQTTAKTANKGREHSLALNDLGCGANLWKVYKVGAVDRNTILRLH